MLGQRWTTLQELPAFQVLKKPSLLESTGLQLHLVTKLSQLGKKRRGAAPNSMEDMVSQQGVFPCRHPDLGLLFKS